MAEFNGLGMGLGNLARLSNAQTRSISAENFTGEKGRGGMATEGTGAAAARDLGRGWKISPSIKLAPGEVRTLADIQGSGAIQHIWLTTHKTNWRRLILRALAASNHNIADAAKQLKTDRANLYRRMRRLGIER